MRKKYEHIFLWIAILLVPDILILNRSCIYNDEWERYYTDTPGQMGEGVLDLISQNPDYSEFAEALEQYGYEEILSRNQYFTLFVPTNAAFDGIQEYSTEEWKQIIGFHILYFKMFSHDFAERSLLTTNGKYLQMKDTGNGGFTIFQSTINMNSVDKYCRNGVIHEIDRLLIPKPNVYEYIMAQDSSFSILKDFLNSMDKWFIDYEKSERIGVDDNGNAIYDTVWRYENYFLDQVAGLTDEARAFTCFLPGNEYVREALEAVSEYFGTIDELDEFTYGQLLFITFSGSFLSGAYLYDDLPDTTSSVTGKVIDKSLLGFSRTDVEVSNGIVHLLDRMTIPRSYFLLPITIECDRRERRTVSNTIYPIEQRSDSRASNGTYVWYGCQFVGDYLEFTVDMVLKATYWIIWTGPKLGPSHYQVSVWDESQGAFVPVGDPVNNWTKGNFVPVVSGTYAFEEFGTKKVRITIVDELPLVGYNSIYVDYIKLVPDDIYIP